MINSGITKVMVNGKEKILKADGYRGPITEAAIAQYQKSKGSSNITKNNKFYQLDYNKVKQQGDARKAQAQSIINNFNNYVEGLNKNASKNTESKKKAYQTANKNTKVPMAPNNLSTLQENLWNIGAFNGVKNKRGQVATVQSAIDGLPGSMTNQAIENAKNMGYFIDEKAGTVSKNNPASPKNKPGGLASMYEMTHAAQTGGMSRIPLMRDDHEILEDNGHAIYLHYPNFVGHSKNAIKIGNYDLGEMIGDPDLPVGHAATILIDNSGNANYYEYGRYSPSDGHLIGAEQRSTVKGGNWRHFSLPKQKQGENDSVYVSRIQHMLPDTKTGAYQAMSIPSVDVIKAKQFIQKQADDSNREEYGIFNTCATGACNATLNFRKKYLNNSAQANNREGYSEGALSWSHLPFTTDSYATKARKASSKVYIMNNSEKK